MFVIVSFYKFVPLTHDELFILKTSLLTTFKEEETRGLTLLSPEGVNTTVSLSSEKTKEFLDIFNRFFSLEGVKIKYSHCKKHPFKKFLVDIREEIITLHHRSLTKEEIQTVTQNESIVSPEAWDELLEEMYSEDSDNGGSGNEKPVSEKSIYLIDTRNHYESEIGTFKGALTPQIEKFTEFNEYFDALNIPKDKKVMMFCTGGVRCEKLYLDIALRGYKNIYQLEGGILNYLEASPQKHFKGECFVFDHRVSVDQHLEPSEQYALCPHCGYPGDTKIQCGECGKDAVICKNCQEKQSKTTCTKNCQYHFDLKKSRTEKKYKDDVSEEQAVQ
jgi:UPF0176 protein